MKLRNQSPREPDKAKKLEPLVKPFRNRFWKLYGEKVNYKYLERGKTNYIFQMTDHGSVELNSITITRHLDKDEGMLAIYAGLELMSQKEWEYALNTFGTILLAYLNKTHNISHKVGSYADGHVKNIARAWLLASACDFAGMDTKQFVPFHGFHGLDSDIEKPDPAVELIQFTGSMEDLLYIGLIGRGTHDIGLRPLCKAAYERIIINKALDFILEDLIENSPLSEAIDQLPPLSKVQLKHRLIPFMMQTELFGNLISIAPMQEYNELIIESYPEKTCGYRGVPERTISPVFIDDRPIRDWEEVRAPGEFLFEAKFAKVSDIITDGRVELTDTGREFVQLVIDKTAELK